MRCSVCSISVSFSLLQAQIAFTKTVLRFLDIAPEEEDLFKRIDRIVWAAMSTSRNAAGTTPAAEPPEAAPAAVETVPAAVAAAVAAAAATAM